MRGGQAICTDRISIDNACVPFSHDEDFAIINKLDVRRRGKGRAHRARGLSQRRELAVVNEKRGDVVRAANASARINNV